MNLILNNERYEYENTQEHVNELFQKINEETEKFNLHVSHLIVNGEDVYENHGEYILEKLEVIDTVEVVTKTAKEMLNDILISAESYLSAALPEIDLLVNDLYNNPTEETWGKFSQLIEGLQWLIQMIQTIDQFEQKLENWDNYLMVVGSIQNEVNTLMEAMENMDTVLIADIIQYEIQPLLMQLKETVTTTIDNEGERTDLS